MKRLLISAIAAGSLAAAVTPALAQPYGRHDNDRHDDRSSFNAASDELRAREGQLAQRIDAGYHRGDLNRAEYQRLWDELHGIQALHVRYVQNGYSSRNGSRLSPSERDDLSRRLDRLSDQVFRQRHDDDRRFDRRYH
jgi:hypothetical protein